MSSTPTLWKLVAALLALHAALVLAAGRRPARDPVWALLPVLPLAGSEVDDSLAATGLLLPAGPPLSDPERFGTALAERLGETTYLGPTLSVDDFARGLVGLHQGAGPGLRAGQIDALRPILARLAEVRAALTGSEGDLRAAGVALDCARNRLLEALTAEERATLLGSQVRP
jgi:hypothetical protein